MTAALAGLAQEMTMSQPSGSRMRVRDDRGRLPVTLLLAATLLILVSVSSAETKKEFHYTVGAGSTVSLFNENGNITVRPASGRQVSISATLQSAKVEVDCNQNLNRITARTHVLQKPTTEQARVDYDVQVPADANVIIDSGNGAIRVDGLQGSVNITSDAGEVTVNGINNGNVQVQAVNGQVNLNQFNQSRVTVSSTGGNVQLTNVTGPKVSVQTTTGNIAYTGDFNGGGSYSLSNHTGNIDVHLPSNASIDLSARSIKGGVENDFPFQKNIHPAFQLSEGRSFAGTSNSGASSVDLRSFSGRIRVKKQ